MKLLFNNKKRKLKLLKKTCKIKIMNKKRKALKIQILSATIKIAQPRYLKKLKVRRLNHRKFELKMKKKEKFVSKNCRLLFKSGKKQTIYFDIKVQLLLRHFCKIIINAYLIKTLQKMIGLYNFKEKAGRWRKKSLISEALLLN